MPPSEELKRYQRDVADSLRRVYPTCSVEIEWSAMRDEPQAYSPRVDIAVGPFAVEGRYIAKYDALMDRSRAFVEKVIDFHNTNISIPGNRVGILPSSFSEIKVRNRNARCLLAVEIENKVTRKHLMGGAVNAAALGRIGIVVGWSPDKVRALIKLRAYFRFLGSVGKNTYDTTNLLILDKQQLVEALNAQLSNRTLTQG